ncbi:MAG: phenylalanine--tRNA ligase subunit beta [Oscillospiraceae bacterium]|nr:phenylalanine--tRNA ligase subunit beta [Oscillospiraceae bacterium]
MKCSKRWLSEHVKLACSDKQFADAMTMSGSKVEAFAQEGSQLQNIVVGLVTAVERHADSDRLWVCQIDVGGEQVQIVTAAQNVTAGCYVPVAKDNSVIAGGVQIKKTKMRGVASQGMLCGIDELGLTQHDFPYAVEDGIFLLGDDCTREPGLAIQTALGLDDIVTEFEITSNRPDCLSVVGLAREAAATFGVPFVVAEPALPSGTGDVNEHLKVQIDEPSLCYRYAGAVVQNVRVAPSPRWLRERLRASGVRPINNMVDITNYVMLEFGQPMHAFDSRYLDGGQVVVRRAAAGEKITTLDGTERELRDNMLVIADAQKPVAVAGVMGGEFSGVMDDTQTVVFESACFYGQQVRATAKALGLRTESSARYEKELDPDGCVRVLARALELVQELDAGDIVSGVVDVFPTPKAQRSIHFDYAWASAFIGIDCPAATQVAMLESLGCTVNGNEVTVPTWRNDLVAREDLAEEVARLFGYDKIPHAPLLGLADARLTPRQLLQSFVGEVLRAQGFSEIQTWSFISPKGYDKLDLPADSFLRRSVVISNPLGEDTSVMRTIPLPSMLEVLSRNYNNRNVSAALYELATIYLPPSPRGDAPQGQGGARGEEELPEERTVVTLGMYGAGVDFFTLKGAIEQLLARCGVAKYDILAIAEPYALHPGRAAALAIDGEEFCWFGEVSPQVQENYELGMRAYTCTMNFNVLFANADRAVIYKPLPRYPGITRDLALVCDVDVPVLTLQQAIEQAAGKLCEQVALFDVYTGEQVAAGKKSVAFSLRLRSAEGTLTDEQADAAVKRCVKALDKMGVSLRA